MRALAPHIHFAAIGDDVVLLDDRSDAYLCIPDGVGYLRLHPDGVHLAPTAETLAALEAAGYLAATDIAARRDAVERPRRNLDAAGPTELRLADLAWIALAVWDLMVRYRRRSLGQILDFAVRSQPGSSHDFTDRSDPEVERLARVYRRVSPWLPIPRKCLVQSFVLLRVLQRAGRRADWVLGVATWPFTAHCWIQVGDQVLDDYWERLLAYEPILAVR